MANFRSKKISRMDKKYTGEVLIWLKFAFFNKNKIFILLKFGDFLGFLKFSSLVAKSEIGKGAFKYYVIKEVGGWVGQMMMFDDVIKKYTR